MSADLRTAQGQPLVSSVQALMQWPGKLRITDGGTQTLVVPSQPPPSGLPSLSNELIEALVEDSVDGFLATAAWGGAVRAAGFGFSDPVNPSSYAFDVYSVLRAAGVPSGSSSAKLYWFDNATGLLLHVVDTQSGKETLFYGWRSVAGNRFPTYIERRSGGSTVLFVVLGIPEFSPAADDGVFPQ